MELIRVCVCVLASVLLMMVMIIQLCIFLAIILSRIFWKKYNIENINVVLYF